MNRRASSTPHCRRFGGEPDTNNPTIGCNPRSPLLAASPALATASAARKGVDC